MIFFEKLFLPTGEPIDTLCEKLLVLIKDLSISWRSYIEDLEGAKELPELQYGIIISLIELMMEIDASLASNGAVIDKEHYLAMALEDGLRNIVFWPGNEIIQMFQLSNINSEIELAACFCNSKLDDLSIYIPNTLVSDGTNQYIKVLKNWVRLIDKFKISPELIEDLVLRR